MKGIIIKTIFNSVPILLLYINTCQSQTIFTYAGTGAVGFNGDGGPAVNAQFNGALGVAVDGAGNVYVSDYGNQRIRKINTLGVISTFAGTGVAGFSGDGGLAINAQINGPGCLAVDAIGNIYFPDNFNNRIRKIDLSGVITTIAGIGTAGFSGDGGFAINAQLNSPIAVALDSAGNLYFTDSNNMCVRKVDAAGVISTLSGGFNFPRGIAADAAGNVYVSDIGNNRVCKINTLGGFSVVAGTGVAGYSGDGGPATNAQLNGQYGIALDGIGNLYIADRFNQRFRKVNSSGIISTIVGTGIGGFSGDGGPAVNAQVANPYSIAANAYGDLFLCDYANQRIRKVCPSSCAFVGVNLESKDKEDGIIFPNPTKNDFKINNASANDAVLVVTNNLGQKILEQKISQGLNKIDTREFPNGIYYVLLDDKQNTISTKLMIDK